MKKSVLLFIMLFAALEIVNAQAKKPRLVVIPSDALMNKMGLINESNDMGETVYIPDYKKAFLDDDLKGCIAKINEMFNDRHFPLTSLEQELSRIQGKVSVIPVDIRLELNYKIEQSGPRKLLYFELSALDQYSSKQIGGTSGESKPAIGASSVVLLQEAVLSHIDKFCNDLDVYFNSMLQNGRESRLCVRSNCDAHVDGKISEVVEEWLSENCTKGAFSTDEVTEEQITVSQAMMPLFDETGKALAASDFYKPLMRKLSALVSSKNYEAKLDRNARNSNSRGGTLGDAVIVISEPSGDSDF